MRPFAQSRLALAIGAGAFALAGCASGGGSTGNTLPPATFVGQDEQVGEKYIIGALDELTVFVWRNPELGAKVQVRPDGRSRAQPASNGTAPVALPSGPATIFSIRAWAASSRAWQCRRSASPRS